MIRVFNLDPLGTLLESLAIFSLLFEWPVILLSSNPRWRLRSDIVQRLSIMQFYLLLNLSP